MMRAKRCRRQVILLAVGLSLSIASFADSLAAYSDALKSTRHFLSTLKPGHPLLQLGGYWSTLGSEQHIDILSLIGDDFTVTKRGGSNGLVGVGYFVDGQDKDRYSFQYGLNASYLAKTGVVGDVIQESLFTNLAYRYNVTHYPLFAVLKALVNNNDATRALTVDVGIGPNFMTANGFTETSLDAITIPDGIFYSHTATTFAATIGVGVRVNHFFGPTPLECGYRFYYLGQGHFDKLSNQVLNTLNTGSDYANALMCAVIF